MVDGEAEMHGLAWQPEGGLDLGHVLGLAELLPAVPQWVDEPPCRMVTVSLPRTL